MDESRVNLNRSPSEKQLKLAAFDFDHTLIDVNSDTYLDKLLSGSAYPAEIEQINKQHGWTQRMGAVFEYLRFKLNVSKTQLLNCMREIKLTESMKRLLVKLHEMGYELLILSDANSIFIETVLESNDIGKDLIKPENIFTNRAYFDDQDCLRIVSMNQDYNMNGAPFDCFTKICAENICKGKILSDFILSRSRRESPSSNSGSYSNKIFYFGDSSNDYCPCLVLTKRDSAFIRKNYSLERLFAKKPHLMAKIHANTIYWTDGQDILDKITF